MKKVVAVISGIFLLLICLIVGLNILKKGEKVSGSFSYDEKSKEYNYNNLMLVHNLELSYDVTTEKYTIFGNIKNNSNNNYKNLKITLELFNINGETIDTYIIKLDKINKNKSIEFSQNIENKDELVYEYKITNIEVIKR